MIVRVIVNQNKIYKVDNRKMNLIYPVHFMIFHDQNNGGMKYGIIQ